MPGLFGPQATPNGFAAWLWGEDESAVTSQYPQLSADNGKAVSPLLEGIINANTTLASQLDSAYSYGVGSSTVIQPYAVYWNPPVLDGVVGNSIQGMYYCSHNEMGFDDPITAATINLVHTGLIFMTSSAYGYSLGPTTTNLDPNVYGAHPLILVAPEPGFVIRRDGSIVFGDPCPEGALYYYDYSTYPPTIQGEESDAACFGDQNVYLIVPQTVVNNIGAAPVAGCAGFMQVLFGGNGESALAQEISREQSNPSSVQIMNALQNKNWVYWQTSCTTLLNALQHYSVPGANVNFAAFTRIPYDTRIPPGIQGKIIFQSFPSPLDAVMKYFTNPSVTLLGAWQNASLWSCVQQPSPYIEEDNEPGPPPACGGNALQGSNMGTIYAQEVYSYLKQYGEWQWGQSIIRPWLDNYVPDATNNATCTWAPYSPPDFSQPSPCDPPAIRALPPPDFHVESILGGIYSIFNYQDAFARYSLKPLDPNATISTNQQPMPMPMPPIPEAPETATGMAVDLPMNHQLTQLFNSTVTITKTVNDTQTIQTEQSGLEPPLDMTPAYLLVSIILAFIIIEMTTIMVRSPSFKERTRRTQIHRGDHIILANPVNTARTLQKATTIENRMKEVDRILTPKPPTIKQGKLDDLLSE
jgi:hypothetical protein